ncbi:MAG TPA: hypothetical protein VMM36_08710 [Opitutaceae bacterium]|nr:hypothetical protein [Opitutaceae bacterium]
MLSNDILGIQVKVRLSVLVSLTVLLAGCGYILAGEWRDDPKNWKRAFGVSTPGGVIVHHSYYSRAPHFTNEWCYYFELEDSRASRQAIGIYGLLKPSKRKASEITLKRGCPSWFMHELPVEGEVWEYPGADEFFVVIDQARGRIYIHDQQF